MMRWEAKWMVDPGDGIVSKSEFNHPSDDLSEVASDIWNGDSELGEWHEYWLMGLECIGREDAK